MYSTAELTHCPNGQPQLITKSVPPEKSCTAKDVEILRLVDTIYLVLFFRDNIEIQGHKSSFPRTQQKIAQLGLKPLSCRSNVSI